MAERVAVSPRRAETAELPEIARMLARAFHNDPVAAWACRPEHLRPRVLERLFGMRLRDIHPHGEIWTDDELRSVADWAEPDHWHTTLRQDIAYAKCLLHPRLVPRMPMVITGMLGAQKVHPTEPSHWYLAILGTDPSAQGQGLGSAMLAPTLEGCDRDGVDGVSLTVASVGRDRFEVALIPETLARTTLGEARPGTKVNLEADVVARHVARLHELASGQGVSGGDLARWGYGGRT
jgi:ribosomal protein S18 acetylase RimI-like enzyme